MSRPWMPLYIGDYLRDTHHLTTEQHGAYLLLIMHYWTHGSLPTDRAKLKRIVGIHSESRWLSICLAIAPFFDENWKQKRIERELEKYRVLSEKRSFAGQRGGFKSRGHTNLGRHLDQAIAKQTGTQPQPHKDSFFTESEVRASQPAKERKKPAEKRVSDYNRADLEQIYATKPKKPK